MKKFIGTLVFTFATALALNGCGLAEGYEYGADTNGVCSQTFLDEYHNVRLTEQGGNNADACNIFFDNYSGVTCNTVENGYAETLSSDDLASECQSTAEHGGISLLENGAFTQTAFWS